MTDELIQQQIPQQRGNYAVPGLLTGAAIGGGLGVAGAHYKNWGIRQKPDLDKVFAQEPDSFSSQIEKAEGDNKSFLEAAKEETQKIKDAGSEFEKYESELKTNGKTTTVELTDELKNKRQAAQDARDAEFKRIFEQEKSKLGGTSVEGIDVRNPQFKKFGSIAQAPAEYLAEGQSDNVLNRFNAAREFNAITGEIEQASRDVTTALSVTGQPLDVKTTHLRVTSPTYMPGTSVNTVADLYRSFEYDYVHEPDANKKQTMFNKKHIVAGDEKLTPAYERAKALSTRLIADAEAIDATRVSTQYEHFMKFGEFVEGSTRPVAPVDGHVIPLSYTDPKTGYHTGWVRYTDAAKNEYQALLQKTVETQRVELAEQLIKNAESYVTLRHQLTPSEITRTIQNQFRSAEYLEGLGNTTTSATDALCSDRTWIDVDRVKSEVDRASSVGRNKITIDGGIEINGYNYDIVELNKADKRMPRNLNGLYFDRAGNPVTDPKKALEMAQKRLEIAKARNELVTRLSKQLEECVVDNNFFKDLETKIAKAYNEDPKLLEAMSKLVTRFKNVYKSTGVADVEAQARTAAEKALEGSKVANDLAAVEKEIAEFTEKNGKKTEYTAEELAAALKEKFGASTKSDYEKAVKEKAQERLKGLAEKAKFANKTLTGLAAAGTLALLGGLIGMATKDNA